MISRGVIQAVLIATLVAVLTASSAPFLPERFIDFRAFYCAGQAEVLGADPYLEHPLHECEQTVSAPGLPAMHEPATVPVPFPGFVLALFASLARMPFAWALFIWEGCACVAIGVATVLVARATGTSVWANTIVLGFPAVTGALQLGQVTPFVLLAVAGCASLLQSRQPRLAALAALGALLDPHVGLALALGLFVCLPGTRGVLVAGTAALLALGSIGSSPLREWEYVRSVIPAHALANVADAAQFSTTNFAFEVGAAPALALTLGSLWYLGALAVGIIVALRLRTRLGIVAVAYVPAAIAVFGGTHTHLQQLAIAVPAFMLLCSAAVGRRRDLYTVVTFVAAMPWLLIAPSPWLFAAPPALALLFAREMGFGRQGIRLAAGCFAALIIMMIAILRSHATRKFLDVTVVGNPLAEVSWQIFTVSRNVPTEAWYLIAKAPTVIAFVLLFAAIARVALGKPRVLGEC